jgi:hypothetical protein
VSSLLLIGVSCFVKPGYFLGFYFWLDAVVVASLFFEVGPGGREGG